jgi:hypothetical protein
MARKILFPFSIDTTYQEGYAWAITLATKMEAGLWLFTSCETTDEKSIQRIRHSVQEVQSQYQQLSANKPASTGRIKTELLIEPGDLKNTLLTFLQKNTTDITVLDASFPLSSPSEIAEVIDHSKGAIVLSRKEKKTGDDHSFYKKLQEAELYKLPANFFDTLSSDRSLFNYLRNVFKRKTES